MLNLLTITRRIDGQSLTLPVIMGTTCVDFAGERVQMDVPCISGRDTAYRAALAFLSGADIEQRMQYLYIDGNGIMSDDCDDYRYTLA